MENEKITQNVIKFSTVIFSSHEEAHYAVSPQRSLVELSDFYFKKLADLQEPPFQWETFFSFYKLKWSESLKEVLTLIQKLPEAFKNWAHLKKVGPKELYALKALSDLEMEPMQNVLRYIGEQNPDRTSGIQFLEWSVDLSITKSESFHQLLLPSWTTAYEQLKKWRYPGRTKAVQEMKQQALSLSAPKGFKIECHENGDQVGLKLTVHSRSADDLKLQIKKWAQTL